MRECGVHCANHGGRAPRKQGGVHTVFDAQDPFVTGSKYGPRVGTKTGWERDSRSSLDGFPCGGHDLVVSERLAHRIPDRGGMMYSKNADQYIQRRWSEVRSQVIAFVVDGDGRLSGSRCELGKWW